MSLLSKIFGSSTSDAPAIEGLTLYHFTTCPYCVRVRSAAKRLGLNLDQRNIHRSQEAFDELVSGGGKKQVPCLRVTGDGDVPDTWMYESDAILKYLKERFGK